MDYKTLAHKAVEAKVNALPPYSPTFTLVLHFYQPMKKFTLDAMLKTALMV